MATSGSFNTSYKGNFYCTVYWKRTGYSVSKNEHYIYYSITAHNSPGNYRTVYAKYLTINDSVIYDVSGSSSAMTCYDGTVMKEGNITIPSSNSAGDGSISIYFAAGVGEYPGTNISGGDGPWSLDRIPRTTSITSHYISGRTSSSLTVSWNAAHSCDAVQYSLNGGSWQNTSGTTYTLSGLAAATQYSIKTRARRSDTGLWAESGTLYGTTYARTIPTISLSSKTSTSITVSSGCNVTVSSTQYRIKKSNGSYGNYQTSATFSGLTPNTSYVIEVKKVGKDSGESGTATLSVTTYQQTIASIELESKTINSIIVRSSCNVTTSLVEYCIKRADEAAYRPYQSSPVFTGLEPNTTYIVQVCLYGKDSGEVDWAQVTVTTLDIARITSYNPNWSVEDPITFKMTNVGNCVMRLYLLYNNVEIIYRNNIEIIDGQYTFELTTEEKNQLYSLAAGETNPDFKFVLRSYYEGVLVGSDSDKIIAIEFPTKAWTKIDGVWKRALVWGRPTINEPWRQCLPWVDINKNKDWKRI